MVIDRVANEYNLVFMSEHTHLFVNTTKLCNRFWTSAEIGLTCLKLINYFRNLVKKIRYTFLMLIYEPRGS